MPLYSYTAVSQAGKRITGSKEAPDASKLAEILRAEGFILTSVKSPQISRSTGIRFKKVIDAFRIFGRVPLAEKMMFARHLSVMVKAGFSLNKALQVLSVQTKNHRFAKIIASLDEDIRKGIAFGDALSKYPDVFSDLFVNMVKVGEATGNLEESLKLLAVQMKKDHDLGSRVRSAMIYPSVILVAMFGIGMAMMIFVMPKLLSVFTEMDVELPFTTQMIILLSRFLSAYWWLVFIVLAGFVILFRLFIRTAKGKNLMDKLILKLPIFGNISKKINSARMARTLSSLVESGVPIVKALEVAAGTLTNSLFSESLMKAIKEVQRGQPLSQTLITYSNLYPPIVIQMIQVGEETGTIGEITKVLAEFYEEEVLTITKELSTIVEPILMIVIGAAVGFFAVSMIQPMYSMMETV